MNREARRQQREARRQQRKQQKQQRKQQREQGKQSRQNHYKQLKNQAKQNYKNTLNMINSFSNNQEQKNQLKLEAKMNYESRLSQLQVNYMNNILQRKNYRSNNTQVGPNARGCNEICNQIRTGERSNTVNTHCKCSIMGGGTVHIKGIGKRKIHKYKNGNKYVIVKGVKKSLNKLL